MEMEHLHEAFHKLLRDNFRSGFDPASIIDRKKFGRAFCSLHHLEAFEADESTLREEARRCCLEWEGKYYAIDVQALAQIKKLFENLRQEGAKLVNLDVVFKKFAPQFLKLGIISPDIFKIFLRQNLRCPAQPNYLRLNSKQEIADEFAQKLAGERYLPQERIAALFPYITLEDATRWAQKTLKYASLRNGDIYLPSAIEFDENEWQREMVKIKKAIDEQGYFFLNQLDLRKSRANCSELPEAAFIEILKNKITQENLNLKGQIISSSREKKQLSKMIAGYCTKHNCFRLCWH